MISHFPNAIERCNAIQSQIQNVSYFDFGVAMRSIMILIFLANAVSPIAWACMY